MNMMLYTKAGAVSPVNGLMAEPQARPKIETQYCHRWRGDPFMLGKKNEIAVLSPRSCWPSRKARN